MHQKKPRLRDRTDRAWFSHLLWHPARKWSGSILTTPEPARGIKALKIHLKAAPCGLRGCKNWPALFPGRMSYKATKPGLVSVLYLSIYYMVSLFIRAPFYVLLLFIAMCAVFWLLWLSYQYLPSDWLERLLCAPILLCFLGQLSHLPYSFWH